MPRRDLIALVDLDGTVADFDLQMKTDLAALASPAEQPRPDGDNGSDTFDPPWLKARKHLIRFIPGWWENLPVYKPGMEIVGLLREAGFTLMVLTKGPFNAPAAWAEKVKWCRRHLPDASVTITEDKGLVYGRVLVDDWPAYGIRWLQWRPRGLLIVPAQPWNTLDQYPEELHPNIWRAPGANAPVNEWASLRDRIKTISGGQT